MRTNGENTFLKLKTLVATSNNKIFCQISYQTNGVAARFRASTESACITSTVEMLFTDVIISLILFEK